MQCSHTDAEFDAQQPTDSKEMAKLPNFFLFFRGLGGSGETCSFGRVTDFTLWKSRRPPIPDCTHHMVQVTQTYSPITAPRSRQLHTTSSSWQTPSTCFLVHGSSKATTPPPPPPRSAFHKQASNHHPAISLDCVCADVSLSPSLPHPRALCFHYYF